MKNNEYEIINILNNYRVFDNPIKEYPKKMSQFDAYNKDCIVEIKHRDDKKMFWEEPAIEFSKYTFNKEFAKLHNVNFLYINRVKNNIAIYDILYLEYINYDFKWHWRNMPQTTEFNKTEMIPKFVGYLNVKNCTDIIEVI